MFSNTHKKILRTQCIIEFVEDYHENKQDVALTWKALRNFQKPLFRLLFEAICIEKKDDSVNLNSKGEYFRCTTKKISMCNNDDNQCNQCGRKFTNMPSMKKHVRKFHERINCSQCEYNAFGEIDLKHHKQIKHTFGQEWKYNTWIIKTQIPAKKCK